LSFGVDVHGVWAEFTLTTPPVTATQRLRWIEPGTFLMGSSEDEEGRYDHEGPQHPVTLSEGYWLADTACTQALWQAVMGNNPSHFKDDPLRPVEQVSWEDVQEFLKKLEALLPGCVAALPTEAEWEYACRAGTTTIFNFGIEIDRARVNYGGVEKLSEGTVAVKSLPPNGWGLYEMHGNVWEWCADGLRHYDGKPQLDPAEPGEEGYRAVRGGSWILNARDVRSAYRFAFLPGVRFHILGFRFALRSTSTGRERPGGTPLRDAAQQAPAQGGLARAERAPRKKSRKR
jgi:formylglycine-generating enzyme required for sulfatase activity